MKTRKEILKEIEKELMNHSWGNTSAYLLKEILIEIKFNNQFDKEDK